MTAPERCPSAFHAADCLMSGADRVLGSDAARAVGRFRPDGPLGYRAATLPDAPLRATRAEAVADEATWLDRDLSKSRT